MIYLGSDHAGHDLKLEIASYLESLGLEFRDLGNAVKDPDDDYPDYAFDVAEAVAGDPEGFGILACGSGEGVCVAANKVKGVRAVPVADVETARLSREHVDANVLCLSGWSQTLDSAKPIIDAFLSSEFTGEERHVRRLGKIAEYEG